MSVFENRTTNDEGPMPRAKRTNSNDAVGSRTAIPREPSQERSRVRYRTLLDATAELVEERDFADISLYDISDRGKVPPASVYHFFPTKEAAFVALAKRYLEDLAQVLNHPTPLDEVNGWDDLLTIRYQRVVAYYNAHAAFARIAFSGSTISEIRRIDADYLADARHTPLGWLSNYLDMPYLPQAEFKFACLVGIYDGIWTLSYSRHGRIAEPFAREGLRAGIAFCRTFLPDVIPFRTPKSAPPAAPASRDGNVKAPKAASRPE
ncbi:TetR/AcrR family transcriptional regulator [Novosphingobium flavum]|uniref:TetR/AcrR family transcriptional regulator n=1 Tax=Novosphingobium flavum TaxID=1778672 RepID=A0A7X1FNZ4_9SPHN|nr:TetR/AcrR family transcriptional regulator [Novosphingobium flavum]MBC2664296.1 TetR/AcrR family transcriptional regulator [Novosphingobium flavum]